MIARGVLTCVYKVTGTDTTRLGSSKALDYFGTNLQNCTPSLMQCVTAAAGRVFIQPDQAGAEALVVAMETSGGKFRRLFEIGIKPHSYLALQLFIERFRGEHPPERYRGIDPDNLVKLPECKSILTTIKNSPDEYFLGKKTCHANNYDQGVQTFRTSVLEETEGKIVLSFQEAKNFKGIWGDSFKEIIGWQAETIARGNKDHVLRNLFGYPRRFEQIPSDSRNRQLLAFVPQSTVATITNLAYAEIWNRIKKEKLPWLLRNNKHDSLLLDVPESHESQAIAYAKQHMGRELVSTRGEHYAMKVGISVGRNWDKYDETTNKEGLREL